MPENVPNRADYESAVDFRVYLYFMDSLKQPTPTILILITDALPLSYGAMKVFGGPEWIRTIDIPLC